MDKTFLFDLDDTLIKNHHKYSYIQMEFVRWLFGKLGHRAPDLKAIIDFQVQTDSRLVQEKGFANDRFPSSLAHAYKVISGDLGISDPEGESQAYALGMKVFDERMWSSMGVGGLVDGALETLDFLALKGDELILVTKGDFKVQRNKIKVYGLERVFGTTPGEKFHIVDKKDEKVLEYIVGSRDKRKVWHVGNLIKSDVLPGLDAGLNVIYIPCETWSYEKKHEGIPKEKKVLTLNDIREIKQVYSSL